MPNPFIDKIKNALFNGGANFIEKAGEAIDRVVTNKEEAILAKAELSKVDNAHVEAMAEIAFKESELVHQERIKQLEDVANARAMQIEALKQDDKFSKRFLYYLAAFMIAGAFAFGILLAFKVVPEENRRLVEMFADVFLFAGAYMVLQFFFGSSIGSKANGDALRKMVEK